MFRKPLGIQLMGELWDCRSKQIDDPGGIETVMVAAAKAAGATVIDRIFHKFEPQGVSGVVVIQESHLAVHTWPEHAYAAVDIFTCGDHVDPWKALEYIADKFETDEVQTMEISRGMKVSRK